MPDHNNNCTTNSVARALHSKVETVCAREYFRVKKGIESLSLVVSVAEVVMVGCCSGKRLEDIIKQSRAYATQFVMGNAILFI